MIILSTSPSFGDEQPLWWDRHPYAAALLLMAGTSVACMSLDPVLSPANLVMPYMLAVVVAALYLGYWPSVLCASLSVLSYAFLFAPPRFGFAHKDSEYIVTFTALLLVGLVITSLVNKLRERHGLLQEMLDERKAAEREMQAGRERLRLALEGAQMGLWDWNLENDELEVDDHGTAMLGYPREHAAPSRGFWQSLIHEEDLPRVREAWKAHVAGVTPLFAAEQRMRAGDGSWKWIQSTGRVVERTSDGRARRGLGTLLDVTERRQDSERARFLSQHDPLTGLANRGLLDSLLGQSLAHARRTGGRAAVLFVDLDGFKSVNDSLGHHTGDRFLQAVARDLRTSLRAEDCIGRWGGDEFVVVLAEIDNAGAASGVAAKLIRAVGRPRTMDGREVALTCSVGIAVFPEDGDNPEQLIRAADGAMYQAKRSGRNTHTFFAPGMDRPTGGQLGLQAQLRQALERGEFLLYYQPQVDLASGALAGAEALLRWNAPERGLVPPMEYIPFAESTGLIVEIGDWVAGEACRQLARWRAQGLMVPPSTAINVSAIQFRRADFVGKLEQQRERLCGGGCRLELELTESVLLEDADAAIATLERLRACGFRLAVDDFGTGYSSLAYLRRLPLDKLKIDKTFVRSMLTDAPTRAIVEAMVVLAHNVGAGVVAEGVESAEEAALLQELGCDHGQGFHFAAPMPAEAFAGWLQGREQGAGPAT